MLLREICNQKLLDQSPRALWVSSAALLSTGYGDYTPITFLGRFAAVCTALFGIGAVALPAGILASAFSDRKNKD